VVKKKDTESIIFYRAFGTLPTLTIKENGIKNYIFVNFDRINSLLVAKWNGIIEKM
jgi:hypothetical protein